jgi:hypothetical protein
MTRRLKGEVSTYQGKDGRWVSQWPILAVLRFEVLVAVRGFEPRFEP